MTMAILPLFVSIISCPLQSQTRGPRPPAPRGLVVAVDAADFGITTVVTFELLDSVQCTIRERHNRLRFSDTSSAGNVDECD